MKPVVVNIFTALATAIYCRLDELDCSSSDIVNGFNVLVTVDDEFFADGICGQIVTTVCGREIILKFTITTPDPDDDDIVVTTTHDIDISQSKQGACGYVLPTYIAPGPDKPMVWVAFDKRRIFYKWEDPLISIGTEDIRIVNSADLEANLCEDRHDALHAVAKAIIDTILAKVDRYCFS
jgi:hypothetical protein